MEEDEGRVKERRENGKKEIALSRHWMAVAPRDLLRSRFASGKIIILRKHRLLLSMSFVYKIR